MNLELCDRCGGSGKVRATPLGCIGPYLGECNVCTGKGTVEKPKPKRKKKSKVSDADG